MIFFRTKQQTRRHETVISPPFCRVSSGIKKEVTDKWFISILKIMLFVFVLNKMNESIHSSLLRSLPNYTPQQRRQVDAVSTKSKPDCSSN